MVIYIDWIDMKQARKRQGAAGELRMAKCE
jgi:hypothetical protein